VLVAFKTDKSRLPMGLPERRSVSLRPSVNRVGRRLRANSHRFTIELRQVVDTREERAAFHPLVSTTVAPFPIPSLREVQFSEFWLLRAANDGLEPNGSHSLVTEIDRFQRASVLVAQSLTEAQMPSSPMNRVWQPIPLTPC
jgi:hypothetical protein